MFPTFNYQERPFSGPLSGSNDQERPFSGPPSGSNGLKRRFSGCSESENSISHTPCVMDCDDFDSDETDVNVFKCLYCEKSFPYKSNLTRHMRTKHPDINITSITNHQCSTCGKQFSLRKYLKKHEKRHLSSSKPTHLHKCPLCDSSFDKSDICSHFETCHDIKIKTEEIQFECFEDFLSWKAAFESDTQSKFNTASVIKKSNNSYYYYACHRSGEFISRSENKRSLKQQGSYKIDGYCPASIKVSVCKDFKCKVTFSSTHVGHLKDFGHLPLSQEERITIANKIATKVPFDAILDEIRDSISNSGLQRLHLLTKQDLRNIESSFNLSSAAVRHKNDFISVDSWIREMKDDNENSCVLFYKPQGDILNGYEQLCKDDFVLIIMNDAQQEMFEKFSSDCICIDGTHGLNAYGFELISLLIIDDLRQGFPCAFLISNRSDYEVLSLFYSFVKEKAGVATPKVFMTDMADSFYNAWVQVMNVPASRLFCTWHVDRAWRKNLKKIKCTEKQANTYKILRTLLQEREEKTFLCLLEEAVKMLKADEDTFLFAQYFESYYVHNASTWAYAYRLNSGLNTNMHIERMHKTIKYIYLQGMNVKRLDKAIYAIMKFLRDKVVDRLITIHKGKLSSKVKELRKRHATSLTIKNNIISTDEGWSVESSNCAELYVIKINNTECQCRIFCNDCNACIHRYSCTCLDYSIKWNMCKHIHLVCMQSSVLQQTDSNIEPGNLTIVSEGESEVLVKSLSKEQNNVSKVLEDEKTKLKNLFANIIDSISNAEQIQLAAKCAKSLRANINCAASTSDLNSSLNNFHNDSVVHANKKIEPQRKFKLKKKSTKKTLTKPTNEESQNLALSLIMKSQESNK